MKPFCANNTYNNEGFHSVFLMVAHIHRLGRKIVERHGDNTPVRIHIYGAGGPGWLAAKTLEDIPGIEVRGFLDKVADRARKTIFGIPVLTGERPVLDLNVEKPEDIDVLVSAVNPSATDALTDLFAKRLPGIPAYFIHRHESLSPLFPAEKPFVIASIGRAGSTWLGHMMRYMAEECGYAPVRYRITDTRGVRVRDNALDELEPGRYLTGLEEFPASLVPRLVKGDVKAVFLYRDPRDALVSHSFKRNGEFVFDEDLLRDMAWQIRLWRTVPGVFTMTYERLRGDTPGALRELCDFLELPLSDGFLEEVIGLHSFEILSGGRTVGQEDSGSHYRKGVAGDWQNHFSEADIAGTKAVCGDLLVELGYEHNGNW